ncbi:uncharacterized protein NPIL_22861, partial [Nephila pilipes]
MTLPFERYCTSGDRQRSIATFYRHLKKCSDVSIRCPQCGQRMTMDQFYHHHASEQHGVHSRKACVFCFGAKRWAHGEKQHPDNVKHVSECLQRFLNDAGNASSWMEDDDAVDDTCECQKFQSTPHQMLGRCKEKLNAYVGFYDSVLEKPDMWRCDDPVEFTEASGLGKDVYGIVQRYFRGDLVWFHILVKHDAFQTFCTEMEKIRDQVVLLPFWCLCDGLVNGTGRTQHRHMIVACELESAFEDVWKHKIRYEFPNRGRAKKCVKIQDAFHLARAIVYVSQPKSSCDGKIPQMLDDSSERSHFHINRPLHEHSIAFLCTLFPGGIQQLLLEQNGHKNVV